ncbi:MAG: cadherin-like beta sandwich domain-containing protein, partial [Treponema sp.]
KKYRFQLPTAAHQPSAFSFVSGVRSAAGGSNGPVPGSDYTVRQSDDTTLEVVYKQGFLHANEYGVHNLNPGIVLWNKEGRRFNEPFSFKIRANTPPPDLEYMATGKTKTAENGKHYYVLCFKVKNKDDMSKTVIGGELLHKDIAAINITPQGGAAQAIPLTLNASKTDFNIDNSGGLLLPAGNVIKLSSADVDTGTTPDDLPSGNWVLFYKTGVEVKAAAAKTQYKIALEDEKGVRSAILTAEVKAPKPDPGITEALLQTLTAKNAGNNAVYPLSPSFASGTKQYTVTVPYSSSGASINVIATAAAGCEITAIDNNGTVTPLNPPVSSKTGTVSLGTTEADRKTLKIHVRLAANHTQTAEYTVEVRYGPTLSGLTVEHNGSTLPFRDSQDSTGTSFNAGTLEYYAFVPDITAASVTVNATPSPGASISPITAVKSDGTALPVSGNSVPLPSAGDISKITVTVSKDGAETPYTLHIKRKSYSFTVEASPEGAGTVHITEGKGVSVVSGNGSGNCTVKAEVGALVKMTAQEENTYTFKKWKKKISVTSNLSTSSSYTYDVGIHDNDIIAEYAAGTTVIDSTIPAAERWKKLKEAVQNAQDGGTIVIDGEVKATSDSGNLGEIVITKNLTIKGKTGSSADTLNANSNNYGSPSADAPATPHRIFKVTGGTLTLKNITLKKGYAGKYDASEPLASSGAGILLESGSVSLTQVDILNCGAIRTGGNKGKGGGIYIKTGTLTVSGSTLSSNLGSDGGGGVYIAGGTVTLEDTEITDNNSEPKHGGGVYVESGSMRIAGTSRITPSTGMNENKKGKNDVYLKNGVKITFNGNLTGTVPIARITPEAYPTGSTEIQVLDGSTVSSEYTKFTVTPQDLGGGSTRNWSITDEGKLKLTSAVIDGSGSNAWKKLKEAVVAIADGGIINISGEIKATSDSGNSGEIIINKNITIKKADGASSAVLNANKADTGKPKHRIFNVKANAHFDLDGLTLVGGQTPPGDPYPHGGAILMAEANITSTIKDCVIGQTGNSNTASQKGGGIYLNISGGSLTVKNTNILSCTASGATETTGGGGGIYLESGTLIFEGVLMKGNTAANGKGRAVWVEDGSFKIKDSSESLTYLDVTTVGGKNPDDVCLAAGKTITVNGTLVSPKVARITPQNYTAGTQVVEAENGVTLSEVTNKFSVTPQTVGSNTVEWAIDNAGKLKKANITVNSSDLNAWLKLKNAVEDINGPDEITINGTITAPNGSTKIEVKRAVTIKGTNKNSDILDANEKCQIFHVWHSGNLTLQNLTLKKGKNDSSSNPDGGGAIYCADGKLTTNNVIIKECKAKKGGGIYAKATSSTPDPITLKNTEIIQCKADEAGGGIYMNGGAFDIITSAIRGNEALNSGLGGGVYIKDGTFNMKFTSDIGGHTAADGNKAAGGLGGGVYMAGGTFNMTAGIIKFNASKDGAGVYIHKGAFTMNGSILQNKAENGGKGSGIYLAGDSSASLTMNKLASVATTPSASKNDIYLSAGKKINLSEAFFSHGIHGCITPQNYTPGTQVLDGVITAGTPPNYKKFEVTSDGGTQWYVSSTGSLTTTEP